jgi:hypothetical protein
MAMALRLTKADGSVVIVGARKDNVPSKRATKGASRTRKYYNGQQALRRVGGISSDVKAIFHGIDNGSTNYDLLCRVVNPSTRTFTDTPTNPGTDLGGKGA